LPTIKPQPDGYVQSFADSPLDDLNIGESVYLQIIHNAKKYVYITTPYLVLDNEMITALTIAAQSGVDVRVLTPGIPDKKLVYMITRSYYQQLHRAGVKIYEYRPGFLHAKSIVSDDDTAVVGTINMDFRSFFLHFECGTCFYGSSVVGALKQDIMEMIHTSRQIDDEWLRRVPWLRSVAASVLRLFAPLL
ncbi:MAG: phospholipase D-like domain-containing protein, partial [Agathobaculum sp.]|uniref:phospholipase D-like domain-containing protein n=1 Tax=Agathobaculum sp. TaxID=2048138 RepID=UPI003D9502CD